MKIIEVRSLEKEYSVKIDKEIITVYQWIMDDFGQRYRQPVNSIYAESLTTKLALVELSRENTKSTNDLPF